MIEYDSFDFDMSIEEARLKEIFEKPYIDIFYKNEYQRQILTEELVKSYTLIMKDIKNSSVIHNKTFRQI